MKYAFIIVITLILAACSGGRQRISRGGHCFDRDGVDYAPVPLEIKGNSNYKLAEFSPTKTPTEKIRLKNALENDRITNLSESEFNEALELFSIDIRDLGITDSAIETAAATLPPVKLVSGNYYFNSADIFIEQLDAKSNKKGSKIKMHLQQFRKSDRDKDISNDERVLSNKCVSNMPPNGSLGPYSVGAITDFSVLDGKSIVSEKQQDYLVSFKNNQILREVVTANKGLVKAPKNYLKDEGMLYKLYKYEGSDFQYELRSVKNIAGGKVYVAVRYTYVEPEADTKDKAKAKADKSN